MVIDSEKLRVAAAEIVGNRKLIRRCWTDIDDYKRYGVLNEGENVVCARNVEDMSIGEIVTACFTLPPYISKYKKKHAAMADGPEKIKLGVEIGIKERELEAIKGLRD